MGEERRRKMRDRATRSISDLKPITRRVTLLETVWRCARACLHRAPDVLHREGRELARLRVRVRHGPLSRPRRQRLRATERRLAIGAPRVCAHDETTRYILTVGSARPDLSRVRRLSRCRFDGTDDEIRAT
eukprot:2327230-Pleurochrysis_carterae.AAC.1